MLVSRHRLSRDAIAHIRDALEQAQAAGQSLLVEDMDVYQFIDGRWLPVTPVTVPDPSPDQVIVTDN